MDHTQWVIQVLDDSNNRSIEYNNRFWLRKNVTSLLINVCVEDCSIDVFGIAEKWKKTDSILIQNGEKITKKSDFHPGKEALLVYKANDKDYFVFLYTPKK